MADKQPNTPLPYDASTQPALARRAYRLLVVMTFLTLVNTIILSCVLLGPQLSPWLKEQWDQWQARRAERKALQAQLAAQRQWLTYLEPPGKVVYEEDPAAGAKLLADAAEYEPALASGGRINFASAPQGWQPPVRTKPPPPFRQLLDTSGSGGGGGGGLFSSEDPGGATLFLHERTAPGGGRRVVAVRLQFGCGFYAGNSTTGEEITFTDKTRKLQTFVYTVATADDPAPGLEDTKELSLFLPDSRQHVAARVRHADADGHTLDPPVVALDYGNRLRFFAGQPDAADASHFTLPYQLDGRDGVVDGWLKDDGLLLKPRAGRLTFQDGQPGWELLPGPTTGPTTPPTTLPSEGAG